MKERIIKIITLIFVAFLLSFLIVTNLRKPRILILHSYATDFSWVSDIDEGLKRILKDRPYTLRYHYMDTKRHPSEKFKEMAGKTAQNVINTWKPNVIIAVDDNAQKYAAVKYINNKDIKIVFTGVNAGIENYGYDKAENATGVIERIPFNAFKEVFLQILPSTHRKIIHISDDSTSSAMIHDELEKVDWTPLVLVKSFQCSTFKEWKAVIKKSQELGDIMLITHYHTLKDEDGSIVNPKKVIEWTEPRLRIPGIGAWGFFVEDGGMMSVAVSPFEQGEEAAKIAVKIIEDQADPSSIPIVTNSQYVVYVREKSFKSRKLILPKILEAFAKATNNYFEDY